MDQKTAGHLAKALAVACVRNRERSRRVRRHHLDLHPLSLLGPAAAEVFARVEDRAERVGEPGVGKEQVDEARPRDLRTLDLR